MVGKCCTLKELSEIIPTAASELDAWWQQLGERVVVLLGECKD